MHGLASEIFLMLFLVLDNQLLLAGSFFCPGPTGWELHTMAVACMLAERDVSLGVVFNTKKALLYYSDNTDSEPSTSKICEPMSLSSPLFFLIKERKFCTVICCRNRGRIPFYVHQNLFWQLERSGAIGVKKGKSYRRRNTGLSEGRALEVS